MTEAIRFLRSKLVLLQAQTGTYRLCAFREWFCLVAGSSPKGKRDKTGRQSFADVLSSYTGVCISDIHSSCFIQSRDVLTEMESIVL